MMPTDTDLIRLLGLTAQGNRHAFHQLYESTAARLYGLCLKLLRSPEQAQEAVQETYIRLWHHAGEYHEERGAPLAWMASIARYRALDLLRRQRSQLADSDNFLNALADERPGPLEQSLEGAGILALQGCIDELSDPQRDSILMAYYQGFSHDELATLLKTPLGTVKSWIRRGLMSLKRCLER